MTKMQFYLKIKDRRIQYIFLFAVLFIGYFFLHELEWVGNKHLHTLMETAATLLALMTGILALAKYYTNKNNTLLFLGVAFLGAFFLDGYHAVVTSTFFDQLMPSAVSSLIPWSWSASRIFLSILMFLSWWAWSREVKLGKKGKIPEGKVYFGVGIFTIISFLFFAFYPLPRAYFPEFIFGRPEEFIAALFFLLALIGYYRKGHWKKDDLEHWVVISLIVGLMGQVMFMSHSFRLFDVMFDAAHMLKKVSYICVLTGLFISMYITFKRARYVTNANELLLSISKMENSMSGTWKDFMPQVLETVCDYMNWPVGHVYVRENDIMLPTGFWHISDEKDFQQFKEVTMKTTFKSGIGLPGCVLRDKKAVWIVDVTKDSNYPRAKLAKDINVKAAMGFPIVTDGELEMVLEFYSKDALEPDHGVINLMTNTGILLGQAMKNAKFKKDLKDQKLALDHHSIVVITDVSGRIVYVNDKFCEISKYSREELMGQDHRIINSGYHSKEFIADLWKTIANGKVWKNEIKNQAKDGSFYWVDTTIVPFLNERGKPVQYLAIRTDITDRKEKEIQLKNLAEDFSRSNRDLEQFAYVASHDLQEPLRMVASFTQLLDKRYGEQLDEKAKEYIHYAVDGSKRMQNLVDDLLEFSRVGQKDVKLVEVDLNKVLDQIKEGLGLLIKDTNTKISCRSLPIIQANESQMIHLFQNFITNAIKFRKEDPLIQIEYRDNDDEYQFSVSDNGIGIEEKYLDKIFVIFQRLHTREKYEGTGIGLSVCKKIVENYGGEILVESELKKGTTFHFTIKKEHHNG